MRKKVAYLRKSRADIELENTTGEDTLKRHREIIKKLAKQNSVILDVYFEEVVSGETIQARPKIQELLKEVENNEIDEVYVVDVDRLARGDTEDQGRISKTFKFGNTKIVTPGKTYDPNNEFDEDFFEFGLFMSRREYKIINKRLNRGRLSSVNEGKFIGSVCPYGYSKEKLKGQKGYKLIINEEEAKIVKIIFNLALSGIGASNIANHLNKIGSKPRKAEVWVSASIRDIIHNPVYYGMIKWNYRKTIKTMKNGIIYKSRPKQKEYILVEGLHEAIIDEEIWKIANKNSKIKEGKSVKKDLTLQNPLAGLVECGICHRTMQRRNYRSGHIDGLICPLPHCKNVGSHLHMVENAILDSLQRYLNQYEETLASYKKDEPVHELDTNNVELIEKEIEKAKNQLNKAFDLLEQEIYDSNTFIERSKSLKIRIDELEKEKEKYSIKTKQEKIEKIKDIIPKLRNAINTYSASLPATDRNELLKSVINKVYYIKSVRGKGHEEEFELQINIKL